MEITEKEMTQAEYNRLKSWKPMFRINNNPVWRINRLAFATEAEALASAKDLADQCRLSITDYTCIHSSDEPNHRFVEGQNFPIEISPTDMWILS